MKDLCLSVNAKGVLNVQKKCLIRHTNRTSETSHMSTDLGTKLTFFKTATVHTGESTEPLPSNSTSTIELIPSPLKVANTSEVFRFCL